MNEKPLKILWAINILTEVDGQAYPSHLIHAFRMGRDTNFDFAIFTPRRMSIAASRNAAVQQALQNDFDYVFFSDDDMDLHPQTLKTLVSRDKDIIMAMCCIRGYPYPPMVFKWETRENASAKIADVRIDGKFIANWTDCEKYIDNSGLINDVAAVGCPATLIKTSVFKLLEPPWFYTGVSNTEDVYFCMKAHSNIEGLSIAVDTTVPAGHVLKDKQVVYPKTAEILRKLDDDYAKSCQA